MVPRIPPAIIRIDPHHHGKPPPNENARNPTINTTIHQTTVFILKAPARPTTPKTIRTIPTTTVSAITLKAGILLSESKPIISRTPPTNVKTPPSTAKTIANCTRLFSVERLNLRTGTGTAPVRAVLRGLILRPTALRFKTF